MFAVRHILLLMDTPPLIIGIPTSAIVAASADGPQVNSESPESDGCTFQNNLSLDAACASASPTFMSSWPDPSSRPTGFKLAMGCEDGSIFIFTQSTMKLPAAPSLPVLHAPLPLSPPMVSPTHSRQLISPSPSPSRRSHRSGSQSYFVPPIAPSRSTILTSGVSKAQVQASKTFVDYDDEPDRLRDMLKTNRSNGDGRRRSQMTGSTIDSNTGVSPLTITSGQTSPTEELASQPISPVTLAPPSFPTIDSSQTASQFSPLSLGVQVTPPRIGYGHTVTSLKVFEAGSSLACLQNCGSLSVFATNDGRCITSVRMDELPRIRPPLGCKSVPVAQTFWSWKGMRTAEDGNSTLLFLTAQGVSEMPTSSTLDNPMVSPLRITVIRVHSPEERTYCSCPEDYLEKVGDWITDGPAGCVGLQLNEKGDLSLYRLSSTSHLLAQTVQFLPHPPSPATPVKNLSINGSSPFLPLPISQSFTQLQQLKLPNPFKSSTEGRRSVSHRFSRSTSTFLKPPVAERDNDEGLDRGRIELGDESDLGLLKFDGDDEDLTAIGLVLTKFGEVFMGCLWTEYQLQTIRLDTKGKQLARLASISIDKIQNVHWLKEDKFVVTTHEGIQTFKILKQNNQGGANSQVPYTSNTESVVRICHENIQSCCLLSSSTMLVASRGPESDVLSLGSFDIKPRTSTRNRGTEEAPKPCHTTLWEIDAPLEVAVKDISVVSVLPLELDLLILGLGDGTLAKASLEEWSLQKQIVCSKGSRSSSGLDHPVLSLDHVRNSRTRERFVLGSSFNGSVAVWSLQGLELRARWTLFATPLLSVIDLTGEENVGGLKDCLLCVAEHGTIAVILIDGFELLYLIPGSSSPLDRICIGGDNLLLLYSDDKGRLWDIKTQEFWRSMTRPRAEELLHEGGWFEAFLDQEGPRFISDNGSFGCMRRSASNGRTATAFVDIREFIDAYITTPNGSPTAPSSPNPTITNASRKWNSLRPVLRALLAASVDVDFDDMCTQLLGSKPEGRVPFWSFTGFRGAVSHFPADMGMMEWRISSQRTGDLLLVILSLLRAASALEEWESLSSQISIYLSSSLPEYVGEGYKAPSLETLAGYWFDPCNDVKHAARSVFTTTIQRLTVKQASDVVEKWRRQLPSHQVDDDKESQYAATALIIAGHVAVENYAGISVETLTDIAKSISAYLHDEGSLHRVLAIELCSLGFHVWQHYIDAVNVLRALFELATAPKKDTASSGGTSIPQTARAAVLQIASTNTALFMTTLTMDISQPASPEHKKSVMQLVVFIIRKKPLVLYPNLTRLVEAVVKSLDPNASSSREAVFDPAIEILGHVVRTFPTVDFHTPTQRLAVGTNEGAVIMYDLKTATRLYVLEGHKKRLSAISFSPDGRRLVTASLDESVVMVWKVGSSFSSFFNPGAPPRQGGSVGSDAFKTLPFNVGNEAYMTIASTLDWVAFEWPTERTARLKIRDSVLTFNT
ncbi:hypothetical protein FRB94_013134 [Tulasnella sp. JGI-2019a]|nr:hypothetical protein FRB94_013134 [Tulasnella sp. JGI-2019a]